MGLFNLVCSLIRDITQKFRVQNVLPLLPVDTSKGNVFVWSYCG